MEDIETLDLLGTPLMEGYNLITMLLRFSFNMLRGVAYDSLPLLP